MDVLLDLNTVLDLLIPSREHHPSAREVDTVIRKVGYTKWIAASSVDNLYRALMLETKRLNLGNQEKINLELKKFLAETRIFSISGQTVRKALELGEEDLEDVIACLGFRSIAPEGIIVSQNKALQKRFHALSPEEFIEMHDRNDLPSSRIPLLNLPREYRFLLEEIDEALLNAAADAHYILGPAVRELEEKVARYLGVKHCIGVASGTDALLLSLRALAIKRKGAEYFDRDDLIITTPFTFTATGDTILRAGATPLFVDIDPKTLNIDPRKVCQALESSSQNVVGIVPVHLFGLSCDMDAIMELAKAYNLFVLEDVAQAFGGTWRGKKLGSIGDAGAFSFFPTKNLGCFGDGGMIATNDDEIADLVRALRVHGGKDKYNVDHIGYKARLDTLQAAILLVKLNYVDQWNKLRQDIARAYNGGLADIPDLSLPPSPDELIPQGIEHVYHQYTVRVKNEKRDTLREYLKAQGIEAMVYYPVPLHRMRVFAGRCKVFGGLHEAEKAAQEVLSLPIEPLMGEREIRQVIEKVRTGMGCPEG